MHDDSKRNVNLSENPTSPALISPPLFLPLLLLLLLLLLLPPAAYSARVVDSLPKTLIPSSHQVALPKKNFTNKSSLKNKTQIRNNQPQLPTTYVKKKTADKHKARQQKRETKPLILL
jgi:hypothetical protein